jgi:hypothetical protein
VEGLLRARRYAWAVQHAVGPDPYPRWVALLGCEGVPDAHHILKKNFLGRELSSDGLGAVLMDPRNGAVVCRRHHDLLEGRAVVPSLAELPGDVFDFARELGVSWRLERDYPAESEAA